MPLQVGMELNDMVAWQDAKGILAASVPGLSSPPSDGSDPYADQLPMAWINGMQVWGDGGGGHKSLSRAQT